MMLQQSKGSVSQSGGLGSNPCQSIEIMKHQVALRQVFLRFSLVSFFHWISIHIYSPITNIIQT